MELFAPDHLPAVGIGDLQSLAAICGLLGLAVTSGILVAEGAIGTLLFVAGAFVVLQQKADLGGSAPAAAAALSLVALAVAARLLLLLRARREAERLAGAARDAPETRAASAAVARREAWAHRLAFLAVLWAGASVGVAWSEWNEVPFRLDDAEAFAGLGLGLVGAAVGGDAAWRFLHGAVRAGGSAAIVGTAVAIAAYVLKATSIFVPFAGAVVFVLAAVLALRLRRRQQQKYAGLRILS